jgi:hypothetical protein
VVRIEKYRIILVRPTVLKNTSRPIAATAVTGSNLDKFDVAARAEMCFDLPLVVRVLPRDRDAETIGVLRGTHHVLNGRE